MEEKKEKTELKDVCPVSIWWEESKHYSNYSSEFFLTKRQNILVNVSKVLN